MSQKNFSILEQKDWSRMIRKLAAGKPMPKDFTFCELANICHGAGLFQWMLQGRPGFSLSKGDYIELTPKSASRFGMFLAEQSGRCSWLGGLGILKFSRLGHGREKRYRIEESDRASFFAPSLAGPIDMNEMAANLKRGLLPPPAPAQSAPTPPAPVIAKLCVSADNKIVSIGKLTFAGAKALEAWSKDQLNGLSCTVPTGTEAEVCADIARRQAHGVVKYGITVAGNPLGLRAWLQHAYEETLDQAIYLKRAMEEMDAKAGVPSKAGS